MKNYTRVLVFVLVIAMFVMIFAACSVQKEEGTSEENESAVQEQESVGYRIQFDLNYDGAESAIEPQTVEEGGLAVMPDEPIREDFSFEGWYADAELTTAYDFSQEVAADSTVYAKWSEAVYYIAGNFTGYDAKMAGYSLKTVDGMDGWYWIAVELTEDVRDAAYDGHYYKITNGTWDADGCWGTENYELQPAPESPTGGGLGSIWVYDNVMLTVYFDSVNKVIYDDTMMRAFAAPRIYGDFNAAMERGADWSTVEGEALDLLDSDGDGVFEALYKLPKYEGTTEEGYSMAVALSEKYYISEYGNAWGIAEQYKFDGEAAGMGGVSYLKPEVDTIYEFMYNSSTNITTVTPLEADQVVSLANPTVYGDFTAWAFEGASALILTDEDGDGVFTGSVEMAAYTGDAEGYMAAVALSKKLYDDEYGIRWGVEEQYKFDGEPAGMGGTSFLTPEEDTTYTFSFDSSTNITTITTD